MTIQQAIEELQEIEDQYGNLDIYRVKTKRDGDVARDILFEVEQHPEGSARIVAVKYE